MLPTQAFEITVE